MADGHFHCLVRMHPEGGYSDKAIRKRHKNFHKDKEATRDLELSDGQVADYRAKLEDLSEFMKEVKQTFSRFYNKRHGRKGFFWSERFKSVIVDPSASTWIGIRTPYRPSSLYTRSQGGCYGPRQEGGQR